MIDKLANGNKYPKEKKQSMKMQYQKNKQTQKT